MNKRCLICYGETESEDYHPRCAFKFFQRWQIPELPYTEETMNKLARQIIKSHATITGVQEKISLDIDKQQGSNRLTIAGLWGRFILKPPTIKYSEMPEVEHLSMRIAHELGITVVPHALIKMTDGKLAYISRRIDRPRKGSKLQMEDMCQLTLRFTEDKYKSSMENIAKAIKNFSSAPMLDVVNFFEITVFSFLIGNADMHLKNFSLMWKDTDHVALSPAYDMLSTRLLISEKDDPEEMALTLNGKKNKIFKKDFFAFGTNIGLNEKQIENAMAKFPPKTELIYEIANKSFVSDDLKNKFTELIKERIKRLT